MCADRALVFVHRGMDVEEQWERAVYAMSSMSNLEISMVWQRLSSSAYDFRVHSEYKCLFKRAVREVETRVSFNGCKRKCVGGFNDNDVCSVRYEFPGHATAFSSRESSGLTPDHYTQQDKDDLAGDLLETIEQYGIGEEIRARLQSKRTPPPG